jgi:hypothetical protein
VATGSIADSRLSTSAWLSTSPPMIPFPTLV